MKRTVIFIAGSLALALLFVGGSFFFFVERNEGKQLEMQMKQEKMALEKWQKKAKKMLEEKEELEEEVDSLHDNVLHYLGINNDLQEEITKLRESAKELEKLETVLVEKDAQIAELEKTAEAQASGRKAKDDRRKKGMVAKVDALNSKVNSLESTLTRERGLYHYNLGVAYTKAKLYEEALAAYEKSLEFQPDNDEAHYNLGILYGEVERDFRSAIIHYNRYLELNPKAEDFKEVQGLINKYLENSISSGSS